MGQWFTSVTFAREKGTVYIRCNLLHSPEYK